MTRPRQRLQEYEPPRGLTAAEAAHLLGLNETAFSAKLPELLANGFPRRDPLTGRYDRKAIDLWLDRRSGIGGPSESPADNGPGALIEAWRKSA